jgi:hypothetical protein
MKNGASRTVRRCLVGALFVALASCGGDDTARPPVVVITPEPVRGILAQTSFSGFQSDIWVSLEIILSQKGVVDITVDWTTPSTWMYVYMGRTNCTYQQLAGRTCPFFLKSETKDPKPRVLYTESLDPGTYYLVLYNVPRDPLTGNGSDNTESVGLQLGLTVYPFTQRVPGAVSIGRTQIVAPQQ